MKRFLMAGVALLLAVGAGTGTATAAQPATPNATAAQSGTTLPSPPPDSSPPPAAVMGTCTAGIICGWVANHSSSAQYIVATDNWPPSNGNWQYLYPGQASPYKDTDGFYVPTGCRAIPRGAQAPPTYHGGQWHKISDFFSYTVTVYC